MAKKTSVRKAAQTDTRRPVGISTLYADWANVNVSPAGIKLSFGNVVSHLPEGTFIEEHTAVGMSAEYANQLVGMISRAVRAYEKQYGGVRDIGSGVSTIESSTVPSALGGVKKVRKKRTS